MSAPTPIPTSSDAADDPQTLTLTTTLSDSPTQSIPDLIWYLKASFRDSDFALIENILLQRELSLQSSNSDLTIKLSVMEERCKTLSEKAEQVSDLESKHRKAVEELQGAVIKKLEAEDECRSLMKQSDGLREVVGRMENERKTLEEKFEGLEREKRGRIEELVGRNKCLEGEARECRRRVREKEEELGRVAKERNRLLEEERRNVEELRRKVREKEEEIHRVVSERGSCIEEERRNVGELRRIVREMEEEVRVVTERNRGLEEETRVALERNKGLLEEKEKIRAELEESRGRLSMRIARLEKHVKSLVDADARVCENFGGATQDAASVDKATATEKKEDDQNVTNSSRKKLLFSPEISPANSASAAEKPTPHETIDLCDSDDDDDHMTIAYSLKRKRASSESFTVIKNHHQEPGNPPPSTASSAPQSEKFVDPPGFTVSALRKCDEKLAADSRRLASLIGLDVTDGQIASSDSEDEPPNNPVASQLIASCRKSRMSKTWEHEVDLVYALDKDLELCAKAICALYRQHMKLRNGPVSFIRGGFRSTDVLRGTTLAKFLVDGDPDCKMKKSASDLKQSDPKGHEDLQRIAKTYSRQLFWIYQRKEDPFFP